MKKTNRYFNMLKGRDCREKTKSYQFGNIYGILYKRDINENFFKIYINKILETKSL